MVWLISESFKPGAEPLGRTQNGTFLKAPASSSRREFLQFSPLSLLKLRGLHLRGPVLRGSILPVCVGHFGTCVGGSIHGFESIQSGRGEAKRKESENIVTQVFLYLSFLRAGWPSLRLIRSKCALVLAFRDFGGAWIRDCLEERSESQQEKVKNRQPAREKDFFSREQVVYFWFTGVIIGCRPR